MKQRLVPVYYLSQESLHQQVRIPPYHKALLQISLERSSCWKARGNMELDERIIQVDIRDQMRSDEEKKKSFSLVFQLAHLHALTPMLPTPCCSNCQN